MNRYFPQKRSNSRVVGLYLLLISFSMINSCSDGIRVKNLFNSAFVINSVSALDTLKILPDVIKYTGDTENSFYRFARNMRIHGHPNRRPTWVGGELGSFEITSGAKVHILDFNFKGTVQDVPLINVNQGELILENCDFDQLPSWAIHIGEAGSLELRNVRFSNLEKGAIRIEGGQVKIYDSQFDLGGETAIQASSGTLFEAHKVHLMNTMGTALDLNYVEEVWLDSVRIQDSFKDGLRLNGCDYTLLDNVALISNGRHGLVQNNSIISGLINLSAVGNLINGITMSNIDTLRVIQSEFVGNGASGASLRSVGSSRLSGLAVGHNGGTGVQFKQSKSVEIQGSTFQANLHQALVLDSLGTADIRQSRITNNGDGVQINSFSEVIFINNLLKSNSGSASEFSGGKSISFKKNLISENRSGLNVESVNSVQLDSNRIYLNVIGSDFRSIENLSSLGNQWERNESGTYFSEMGSIKSRNDRWISNTSTALEVLSAYDYFLSNAYFNNNRNAALLNQVSVKFESSNFDTSFGYSLKLMNGSATINESKFTNSPLGFNLSEGSKARVTQSQFKNNDESIIVGASSEISVSFSTISQTKIGIQIGNYGKVEVLSSRFDEIDDYCIDILDPHLQSLTLRQNIITRTGGILKSASNSGLIQVINNTFANNQASMSLMNGSLDRLDHNIFYKTAISDLKFMKSKASVRWNCFDIDNLLIYDEKIKSQNLFTDPIFEGDYFLHPQSKCLNGGENGLQIGALGIRTEKQPELKP